MKALIFTLALLSPAVASAWTENFAFRNTDGYCTDPTDTQMAASPDGSGGTTNDDLYPTTANGVTFGFAATPATDSRRDRDNTKCSSGLAGVLFYSNNNSTYYDFRVDLPATGTYRIRLAVGDTSTTTARPQVRIYDQATLKNTIGTTSTLSSGHFFDAGGNDRTSAADWVTNNSSIDVAFATTEFHIQIGRADSVAGVTNLSYLGLEQLSTTSALTVMKVSGALP